MPVRENRTILTADIQGFSTQMRWNEASVVRMLMEFYSLAKDVVQSHSGELFRREGDAIWCSFPNPLLCLAAAAELHQCLETYNLTIPESDQVRLRMGAHVGEITLTDEGDVLGHTLSVAKRLETACPSGGLLVSEELHQFVFGSRSSLKFQPFGTLDLKGVGAVHAYIWIANSTAPVAEHTTSSLDNPLIDPALYALKIFQAGSQALCTRFDWKLGRHRTDLWMESPGLAAIRPLKLRDWILHGSSPQETLTPMIRDLVLGIRAARELHPQRIEWATWHSGHPQMLIIEDNGKDHLEEHQHPQKDPDTCRFSVVRSGGAGFFTWFRRPNEHVAEHKAAARCRFAATTAYLDGRPVFSPRIEELTDPGCMDDLVSLKFSSRYLLVERCLMPPKPHHDVLAAFGPETRKARRYQFANTLLPGHEAGEEVLLYQVRRTWDLNLPPSEDVSEKQFPDLRSHVPERLSKTGGGKHLLCSLLLAIPAHLEGDSRMLFIKGGVAMQMKRVDLGCPGAVAVVSACGLTVDASRFEVKEDKNYRLRIELCRRHIREMMLEVHDYVELLDPAIQSWVKPRLPKETESLTTRKMPLLNQ